MLKVCGNRGVVHECPLLQRFCPDIPECHWCFGCAGGLERPGLDLSQLNASCTLTITVCRTLQGLQWGLTAGFFAEAIYVVMHMFEASLCSKTMLVRVAKIFCKICWKAGADNLLRSSMNCR